MGEAKGENRIKPKRVVGLETDRGFDASGCSSGSFKEDRTGPLFESPRRGANFFAANFFRLNWFAIWRMTGC